MTYRIMCLGDAPELEETLAAWFHEKWGIPIEAYIESMDECLSGDGAFPEWYAVLEENRIVGGAGVIENDFHDRKDLSPNLCALYVEPDRRGNGIAGALLAHVCDDMRSRGIGTLYLVTDHTSFYERYGWEYLCPVRCDGEERDSRMYVRQAR